MTDHPDKPSTAITAAELAERLLGVGSARTNLDHLIEELRPETGTAWEGPLLEFKASYLPSKKHPDKDADKPDKFVWNVLHAFVALANASGGCVVLGIGENRAGLFAGDWDPEGILEKPNKEDKDLRDHLPSFFFKKPIINGMRTLAYTDKGKPHVYSLKENACRQLQDLVEFYPCRSAKLDCNAIVAIVKPVPKGGNLIGVKRTKDGDSESIYFYRDRTVAKTNEITDLDDLRTYCDSREPARSTYGDALNRPFKRSPVNPPAGFSTVPAPDANFLGRDNELNRLCELCTAGRIPLIHAGGGTGKTQLAFKYASLHTRDYPGGCFYIPAEHVTCWDDALREILTPRANALGIASSEWLGLKIATDNKPQKQSEQHNNAVQAAPPSMQPTSADIINALIRRSRETGKVLLVLDNVEKPSSFFADEKLNQVFPDGFSSAIAIVATSRTTRGISPQLTHAIPFPLGDLTEEAALALLNGDVEFTSEEERQAAEEIVRILGYRALYVRRVDHLANESARRSYKRLYKKLLKDKLHVVQPREDEDDLRAPEVLWQWVRDRLTKTPTGTEDILLAQTVALFPPDGVADRILEALWYSNFGELESKDSLDEYREDPDLFQDALKRLAEHNLIQYTPDEHIVRMHRLDRAAIQKSLRDANSDWQNHIGSSLKNCLCFSPSDWVELGNAHSPLLDHCPWDMIGGSNSAKILEKNPQYKDNPAIPWNEFSDISWWLLLQKQPDFINLPQCKPVFLTPLLAANPELRKRFNPADFTGRWWANLLSNDPSLANHCPWERLKKNDWLLLLSHRPEMFSRCPHKEILNAKGNLEYRGDKGFHDYYLSEKTSNWGKLLSAHPEFEAHCKWDCLSPQDCISILKFAPRLASRCPAHALQQLTGEDWTDILKTVPEIWNAHVYPADTFPRKASYAMTCRRYGDELFPDNLDYGVRWAGVLKANSDAHTICPFSELSPAEWCEVLLLDREYSRENPPWKAIADLLTEKDAWHNMKGFSSFFEKIPLGEKLNFHELDPFRPPKPSKDPLMDAIDNAFEQHQQINNGKEKLIEDIRRAPTLSAISKQDLTVLEGFKRDNVLTQQPQLASICIRQENHSSSYSVVDAEEFQYLLSIPHGLDFSYEITHEHDGDTYTDVVSEIEDAFVSLSNYHNNRARSFSDEFSQINAVVIAIAISSGSTIHANIPWDIFDGDTLCLILVNRPSLKEHCDFSKFSGRDWAVLLSENPAFEDICDWSKLNESDWTYLLNDRPWMINKKPLTTV